MIHSWETLSKICDELRQNGKKIVFTNGCFDIIHAGHVSYLNKTSKLGDVLIVGLNSDDSVSRLKGPTRPINKSNDRAVVLSNLKSVDYVAIFEEDDPLNLIKIIKPDIITKGGDYKPENIIGGKFVTENGGQIIIIPLVEGKSTTSIINKMSDNSSK